MSNDDTISRRTVLKILTVIVGIVFGSVVTSFGAEVNPRVPVVLSTDVGNEIDDQWAVVYLLLQPKFEVLGVMSAHAPTITAPAGRTSYRILVDVVENRMGMRRHPPLIEGGSEPLDTAVTGRRSPAVDFLIKTSRKFSKERRLTVLIIGAATDVASAILLDPAIVDRIRIVQMGFTNEQGGDEFNIANDVHAVQAILNSNVPLVIGPGDVCRAKLSLKFDEARKMLEHRGAIGSWLWEEYQAWYFRVVKPLRVNDFSRSWVIWDDIALAYVLGMTTQHNSSRPKLHDDMKLENVRTDREVTWITDVDEGQLWSDFLKLVDDYQRKDPVRKRVNGNRLTFGMPWANSEWRYYGGDEGGSRFSSLAQINTSNVQSLKRAWSYHTGELDLGLATASFQASFSCTPLVVDGVMYLSTPSSRVIALNAETGRELWKFDPQENKSQREFNSHRGVAYWEDKKTLEHRILFGTVDGRLIALNAETGKPVSQFGVDGVVDLRAGGADKFKQEPSWGARVTSAPVIYKDLVIIGWGLPEFPGKGPSGDVRAFSVRTGKLVWTFHTVPHPGEFGSDTWSTGAWKDRMGANVWSTMSVDEGRGIVYLPVGSPAYDFYGGDRKGKNLFGNSLVALNAATGKLKWYFQLVHHDLWDYDLPAQPSLITVRREGRSVPAVAVITKMGFVFVFDRVTGKALFPIEERPVPQSNVPGEETWTTQPFPVKPPAIARQSMTRDEVSRVSAESQKYCTELFDKLVNKGIYTPAGLEPTLIFPGYHGGGNWSSASFDPASGYLFVNMNEDGAIGQMNPQPPGSPIPYVRRGRFEEYAWFRDQNSRPCQQPPWGTLTAVDLQKGEIAWRVPLGIVEELEAQGIHNTGTQNLGGSIVTAGGLVFVAGTTDRRFRAFDAKTGKQLWEAQLDANGHATPMTFQGRNTGKQFVVVTSGGGGFLRSLSKVLSDEVVAYALP